MKTNKIDNKTEDSTDEKRDDTFEKFMKDKTAKWTAALLIALVLLFLFILSLQDGNLYDLGMLATGALAAVCFGIYFKSDKPKEYLITGIVCAVLTVMGLAAWCVSL